MSIWPQSSRADACPVCGTVHGEVDELWTCPRHLHELMYGGMKGNQYRYVCPAHRCPYERLTTGPRPKEEPMTTVTPAIHHPVQPAPSTEIAVRDGQRYWTERQLAALRQLGIEDAPPADLGVFLHYCQTHRLDPFSRQVTMVKYSGRWTIQTEIDGYRLIGHRVANERGQVISELPPVWFDDELNEYPIWVKTVPPAGAKFTLLVDGAPHHGVASYREFVPLKDGKPFRMWQKMPANQLAKCAEAQAWRKAFPRDFEGTTTTTEAQADVSAWTEVPAPVEASANGDDSGSGDDPALD